MKNSIIKGTGNSRYLKTVADAKALYPTYDDFLAALIDGTLPIDLNGINSAGWQQIGQSLDKDTLLSDEAELAMFGDTADRTLSQAWLQTLSNLNELRSIIPFTVDQLMDISVSAEAEAVSLPMSGIDWSKYDKVVIDHVVSTDDITLGTNWRINGSTDTNQGSVYYRYTSGDAYYQDGRITSTFVGAKRRRVIFNVYKDPATPIMLFHQYEHSFGFGCWPQKTYADFETLSIAASQSGKLVQPGSTFKVWGVG